MSLAVMEVMDSWTEFIDNPKLKVSEKLDAFNKWINKILDNYDTRDVLFKSDNLLKSLYFMDTQLNHEVIDRIRELIKKSKISHISPDLAKELFKAKNEIDILYNEAKNKRREKKNRALKTNQSKRVASIGTDEKDAVLKYFKENPNQFQVIKLEYIKYENFISTGSEKDNTTYRILNRIVEKKGIKMNPHKLKNELGKKWHLG